MLPIMKLLTSLPSPNMQYKIRIQTQSSQISDKESQPRCLGCWRLEVDTYSKMRVAASFIGIHAGTCHPSPLTPHPQHSSTGTGKRQLPLSSRLLLAQQRRNLTAPPLLGINRAFKHQQHLVAATNSIDVALALEATPLRLRTHLNHIRKSDENQGLGQTHLPFLHSA